MISLTDVSYKFPSGQEVLKSISLDIAQGEFIILTGENGSGKSVLTLLLNGIYQASQGEILFENKAIKKQLLQVRKKVGIIFQDSDTQIVGQTVYDDIAFGLENLRVARETINTKVTQILRAVGLENYEKRVPTQLSGGEKKRLAIAGILCMNPSIIIFDEPFNCLDYTGVKQVLQLMVKLHKEGKTILVITHDLDKVFAHANRLIIMGSGRIIYDKNIIQEELPADLANYPIKLPKCLKSEMSWLV